MWEFSWKLGHSAHLGCLPKCLEYLGQSAPLSRYRLMLYPIVWEYQIREIEIGKEKLLAYLGMENRTNQGYAATEDKHSSFDYG